MNRDMWELTSAIHSNNSDRLETVFGATDEVTPGSGQVLCRLSEEDAANRTHLLQDQKKNSK